MQKIEIKKAFPGDYAKLKGKVPTEKDYDQVIDYECEIYEAGKLVCTYKKINDELKKVIDYCSQNSKSKKSHRTLGVATDSAVYGALPRVAVREDYCRFSADTKNQPEIFAYLGRAAKELWSEYKKNFPEVAAKFEQMALEINKDWMKTGTPFSTININKNFAIRYHVDAANMAGVYSNVLVARKGVSGGLFVMPAYRLALAQEDGWFAIVDGVNVVHGVTPINFLTKNAYRHSYVFYTLKNLAHCECKEQETKRMKIKATERAVKRLDGNQELRKIQEKRNAHA